MNLTLPDVADALAGSATSVFEQAGGITLARSAESDPSTRTDVVEPLLVALGIDDIDPCADIESAAAASELCRTAGRVALPYPVEGRLLATSRSGGGLVVLRPGPGLVDHGDLGDLTGIDLAGAAHLVQATTAIHGSRLGPFLVDTEPGDPRAPLAIEAVAALALRASYVLGLCERAVELATEHTTSREQFGQPLADFQTVSFSLADATVATESLRAIVHYAVWRIASASAEALPDALAAHVKACDVAHDVLRRTQQLHGASAFPDEHDISVLARHAQARIRVPYDGDRAALELVTAIERHGFDGLFPHGRAAR